VSSLNAQVEEHEQEAAEREKDTATGAGLDKTGCPFRNGKTNPNDPPSPRVALDDSVEGLENRFGRLVVEKGRSRYINNSFWASLNNEVRRVFQKCSDMVTYPLRRWRISNPYSSNPQTTKMTRIRPTRQTPLRNTRASYSDTAHRAWTWPRCTPSNNKHANSGIHSRRMWIH
jgi:hypothetical protein